MLLSRHICVLMGSRVIEDRVIKVTAVMAWVWHHILILVAEIATASNRMRKSAI